MDRITVILPCTVSALLYKLQTASVQLIQAQMTDMPVGGNKKAFAGEHISFSETSIQYTDLISQK
jgi:hypothetical protein